MTSPTTPGDLRFDVVDLISRPGAHRHVEATVRATDDTEGGLAMRVPVGDPLHVQAHLESVVEGIFVSGTVEARLTGECSRCLDPVEQHIDARLDELFSYPEKVPSDVDPDEVVILEGDAVDLAPLVHDALAVAADDRPLCRPDCPGLCAQCGLRLEDDPDHHHEVIDPRFALLQQLLDEGDERGDRGPEGAAH
ncbi:DUF177 domain-containing protein [Brachybacterium sp. EF45031]|uniref:YceD family protein n=1 Tax=Brachybacterium sillae TaxID=2810536 RepID=UPI00217ECF27|nr:YceD family protein [Brachybacterium sillae]MCS6710842.1 DUF177 domain-containing protein [Brachybacterium sillae]